VKSKVDEKNLDEEISKIKDKLSSKIAERQKQQANSRRPQDDDDLFASPTGRVISGRDFEDMTQSTRRPRATVDLVDDDFMEIDPKPGKQSSRGARKRPLRDPSEDDDEVEEISAMATKKRRTVAAKKPTPASRSRQSSVSSNPPSAQPPSRRTPLRGAASRAKKVPLTYKPADTRPWKVIVRVSLRSLGKRRKRRKMTLLLLLQNRRI
jgi:hypothetical protein